MHLLQYTLHIDKQQPIVVVVVGVVVKGTLLKLMMFTMYDEVLWGGVQKKRKLEYIVSLN